MRFVTTPKEPTTASVNPGTWETDGTVMVMNIQKIHKGRSGQWGKYRDKLEFYS